MTCKHCGLENAQWASFCTQCGKPLGKLCVCSFIIKSGDLYCGGCGRPVNQKKLEIKDDSQVIPMVHQYNVSEIEDLIKESILVKAGKESELDQNDIDEYFKE